MNDSAFSYAVTQENFPHEVLEKSKSVLVLVDFWAAWCGPCQTLMPLLTRLAEDYQGRFLLTKVNSDEQQQLATQYGVRSLPTVKLFKDGAIVDEFMGVQTEAAIREIIERHMERASDRLRLEAKAALEAKDSAHAQTLLQQALAQDPGHPPLVLDYVDLLLQQADADTALTALQRLPANKQMEPEVKAYFARARLAQAATASDNNTTVQIQDNPDDLEARYQLALRAVQNQDYAVALDQFLEIMRRDRGFREDAGRQGLLSVFEILGNQDPLTNDYRRKMASLLY